MKYGIVNSRYRRFLQHSVFQELIQIVLFIFRECSSCFSTSSSQSSTGRVSSMFIFCFLKFLLRRLVFFFPSFIQWSPFPQKKTVIILSRWRPLWLVVFFFCFFFGKGGGAIRWPVSSSSLQVKQRLVLLVCVDFVDQWGYKIPIP